jgi:hypothetical protein
MKSLAGGQLLKTGVAAGEGIEYALSLPIDVLVSGIDSLEVLRENLATVRNWTPLTEGERQDLLQRVAPYADDGHLEKYKAVPS